MAGSDDRLAVLLVEDDAMVRSFLRAAIGNSEFRLGGEAASASAAAQLLERRTIDLLLVDYHLPDTNGAELLRRVRAGGNRTPAVLMTASSERGLNELAREAGAQGTLKKTADRDELLACLRSVAAGRERFDPGHPRRPAGVAALSAREREVLGLAAQGQRNRDIAAQLGIGFESVKTHLERAYGKLGVKRRGEAVTRARELGLLD